MYEAPDAEGQAGAVAATLDEVGAEVTEPEALEETTPPEPETEELRVLV